MASTIQRWNEKRKALRKQSVHEACVRILLRDGVDGMTMDAVSQEARVAKGTLYNYFDSKEDLLACVEAHLFEPIRRRLAEISAGGFPGRVRLYLIARHIARQFERNRALAQLVLAEFSPHPLAPEAVADPKRCLVHEALLSACEDAFGGRPISRQSSPALTARLFGGALLGLLEHRLADPAAAPLAVDLAELMSVFFPPERGGDSVSASRPTGELVQGVHS